MQQHSANPIDVREISLRQLGSNDARHDASPDFVRLCVLANMPRLLQTATDVLLQQAGLDSNGSTTRGADVSVPCHNSSHHLWHLARTLEDGQSLALARTLHGDGSAIARLLESLASIVEAHCGIGLNQQSREEADATPEAQAQEVVDGQQALSASNDGGGWNTAGSIDDGVESGPRCSVLELPRLPSKQEFRRLLATSRPVVIRGGAAAEMGLDVQVCCVIHRCTIIRCNFKPCTRSGAVSFTVRNVNECLDAGAAER